MIELEEPFLRLAAGSGKGITAEIVFSVRITLERNNPEELSVSYEFAEGFSPLPVFGRGEYFCCFTAAAEHPAWRS